MCPIVRVFEISAALDLIRGIFLDQSCLDIIGECHMLIFQIVSDRKLKVSEKKETSPSFA